MFSEIDVDMLAGVTGGRFRAASGGKHGRNDQIMLLLQELKASIEALRSRAHDGFSKLVPMMMAMRSGNPEALAAAMSGAPPAGPAEAPKPAK